MLAVMRSTPRRIIGAVCLLVALLAAIAWPHILQHGTPSRPPPKVTFKIYPIPGSANSPAHPYGLAFAADGGIWFTNSGGNSIGHIDPQGVLSTYPVPTPASSPMGIVIGADGAIWFTEQLGNNIGRLGLDGTFTTFPLPEVECLPTDLTLGPDGAIWFTELECGKIGRISPQGTIQEFTPTGLLPRPLGIVAQDGALWVAEQNQNAILRISPNGASHLYPIPTRQGAPGYLATGPDHTLWFTEQNGDRLGRLDTVTGIITEYPVPTYGTSPLGIALDTQGRVWFTELIRGQIGVLLPGGHVAEYPLSSPNDAPSLMHRAPDGQIWFTEQYGEALIQIVA